MKHKLLKLIIKSQFYFIVLVLGTQGVTAFAADLVYAGRQDNSLGDPQQMQEAQSRLVPVNYSTNYEPQFPSYASFMQPPYSYGGGGPQSSSTPVYYKSYGNPATATSQDPYMASEVSPYSHYSPYTEIVGEGSDYTLGIDDVVTIIVRNQPDFSGRYVIDPEGRIQYNFVGDIPAVGKTKEQLKADIVARLKRFVRYPEVAVMISEYRSKAVYVFGYVNGPGKYAMKGDRITVKEAVVAAGLPRMDGSLKRVYVIRPDNMTKDGKPSKKKVDLSKLLHKGQSAEDFMLEPGDTIVVHQRYFDKFVNNFARLIGPVFQAAAVYELGFGGDPNGYLRKNPS